MIETRAAAVIDNPKWFTILNREFHHALDAIKRGQYPADEHPLFEQWFDEWIDTSGLWSGNLTREHDGQLMLVATTTALWLLEDEWNEAFYEHSRDVNERHPSLSAAERNR